MEKWAICMPNVAILNDSLAFWLSLLERTLNHVLPAGFPHEVGERTRPRKITSPKKSGPGLDWFDLHYCKYVCIKNCWTFPKCTLFLCFSTRQKKKKEKKKKKKNGSGRTPATLASRVTANIVSEDCEEIPFLVPDVGVAVLICLKVSITEQSSSFSFLFFIWTENRCNAGELPSYRFASDLILGWQYLRITFSAMILNGIVHMVNGLNPGVSVVCLARSSGWG